MTSQLHVIDAHVHYREPETPERPYDPSGVPSVTEPYSVEQIVAAADAAGIDQVIQVVPTQMGYDNRYAIEGALRFPTKVLGVFGRFDPVSPDVENRLRAWLRQPKILGIRLAMLTPHTIGWLRDGTLTSFWLSVERLDVPVALYGPFQARAISRTARGFPGVRIIVDHMTLPYLSHPTPFEQWDEVLDLARVPNVTMKVSMLPTVTRESYPFPRAQSYLRQVYDGFGPDRMIWGSDFPPILRMCSYTEALEFVREACDFLSRPDRAAILGGTVRRLLGV